MYQIIPELKAALPAEGAESSLKLLSEVVAEKDIALVSLFPPFLKF